MENIMPGEQVEKGTREYELSFLLRTEDEYGEIRKVLAQGEAKITFESPLARKELAYEIGGERHAYFGFLYIILSPQSVLSVNRALGLRNDILRFLIVTPPIAKFKERKPAGGRRISQHTVPFKPREQKMADAPLSNEEIEKKIEEILQ